MPFSNPSETEFFEPESGKYIIRVDCIEDGADYGSGPTIFWNFELADSNGPILDTNGEQYIYRQLTGVSLGRKAKGREWAEALLGQDITGWTGDQVAAALPGTMATILIGPVKNTKGEMHQRIVSIQPFGTGPAATPAEAPAKQPAAAAKAGSPFG